MADVYIRNGYLDRGDYHMSLADEHGIDPMIVNEVASLLGDDEDFDGLVNMLHDFSMAGILERERRINE